MFVQLMVYQVRPETTFRYNNEQNAKLAYN